MKYAHVIAEALRHPWAVLDAKFDAIVSVLARREAGEKFTEEEIRATVGERKVSANADPYVVDDAGRIFRGVVHVDPDGSVERTSCYEAAYAGGARGKLTAVIPMYGLIMPRNADFDMSEYGTSIESMRKNFRAAVNNGDVRAIVFDVDSPGGSVYQVDEFAQEIFDARSEKKVVAQVNSLSASAAYYLAAQASEVVATPSGEIGSVGVRMMHQDLSEALKLKGIKVTHIAYGKFKVEGNPFEPIGEDAVAFYQQRVNDYGDAFVKALARGRDMKPSEVKDGFGEGRVFGAAEAKRRGMIDRIGTLDETLARLGASAESARVPMGAAQASVNSNTATAEKTQEVQMDTPNTAAVAADLQQTRKDESGRIARIHQLASAHGMIDKAAAWVESGKTIQDVQGEILASLKPAPIVTAASERVEFVQDKDDKTPADLLFGRIVRSFAAAKGDKRAAAVIAERQFGDKKVASMFTMALDPQRASDFASGGFLLGDNVSSSVIELLRPKSVVRSLNPTLAPLVDGVLTLPKITSGATAGYLGETKNIPVSKIAGGQVKASAKTLGVIVPISNKLLRSASANADALVRNDAIRAIGQKEDATFLRSMGTEYSPKGLLYWKGSASFTANSTVNLANVTTDLQKAITALEEANVDMASCGWVLAPRSKGYLMQVRDANGNYAFKDEMIKGTLMGFPFRQTSQIPKNLGGSSNASEVYFAAFADVVIADAPQIAIEMSTEATLDDGAGNLTSLFQADMSAIRIVMDHDLVVRHAESVLVIDTVTWGV